MSAVPLLLALAGCAHAPPRVDYDPLGSAPVAPLVGPDAAASNGAVALSLRNAADHPVWINDVDVVPARAATLRRVRTPLVLAPDAPLVLVVDVRGPAQLRVRTADGVRVVAVGVAAPRRAAPVTAGPPALRDTVGDVVAAELPALQACYVDGLARDPTLRGAVALTFVVLPEGAVAGLRIAESTLPAGEVEACLVARLASLTGPADPARVAVRARLPFVFVPEAG